MRPGTEFESDVIPDSGKTQILTLQSCIAFESDVIPDSGKTAFAIAATLSTV